MLSKLKLFILSLCALVVVSNCLALAAEKVGEKKYPPYPDVWGYDISDYPAARDNRSSVSAYKAPDGDIVFIIKIEDIRTDPSNLKDLKESASYLALHFFKQKKEVIGKFEYLNDYFNKNDIQYIEESNRIELSDNTIIKWEYEYSGKQCQSNELIASKLVKSKVKPGRDFLSSMDEGTESYSIIGAKPIIQRIFDREGMEPCPKGGEIIYKQLYFLPERLIKLEDDTFIAYRGSGNIILRLDKNLKTKFKPQHGIEGMNISRNFFIIPYSIIDNIFEKVMKEEEYGVQGVHDRLLLYFAEEEKKEKETRNK